LGVDDLAFDFGVVPDLGRNPSRGGVRLDSHMWMSRVMCPPGIIILEWPVFSGKPLL
jgi:hypothetical protein